MLKPYLLCLFLIMPAVYVNEGHADNGHADEQHDHVGHSDHLLMLLQQKILLEKRQQDFAQLTEDQRHSNLQGQGRILKKTMPVLQQYMATPKSYYLTTEMYHESLENRAAMLADFSKIIDVYYQQLRE
jgi:hypothetical protein